MRPTVLRTALAVILVCAARAVAQRIPVPLNEYERLGQVFTSDVPFEALFVTVPSWLDNEGGLTLTLWDSLARDRELGSQAFTGVPDNSSVSLRLTPPLDPGTYYWEVTKPTGETRIGLYADEIGAETEDCAYRDGEPEPTQRFVFSVAPAPFRFSGIDEMVDMLTSDAPLAARQDAFRQLSVQGTVETVEPLAGLLTDPDLAHMARYALQPMPFPEVDTALRAALGRAEGELLVGVLNTIALRRDSQTVSDVAPLLDVEDHRVASATALALGRIATVEAARVLSERMGSAPIELRGAYADGLLTAAERLARSGETALAATLCDTVLGAATSPAVTAAALRGAIVHRGADRGSSLLFRSLEAPEPSALQAALWVIQRELPAPLLTQAVADYLPRAQGERKALLATALIRRGDPVAIPALTECYHAGADANLRLNLTREMPRFGEPAALFLAMVIDDQTPDVAAAAEAGLASLPGATADSLAIMLLGSPDPSRNLIGIRLAGARHLTQARRPLLQLALASESVELRSAALDVLVALALPEDIPALNQALLDAASLEAASGIERVLAKLYAQAQPETLDATPLVEALPQAEPYLAPVILRLLNTVATPAAREALLETAASPDPELRALALRHIAEWTDPETAPDLYGLAQNAVDPNGRVLCLRAFIRLVGQEALPLDRRLQLSLDAAALIERPEEKRLLVGMLAGMGDPRALGMIRGYLEDEGVQEEAAAAAFQVAEALLEGPDAAQAEPVLRRIADLHAGTPLAERARTLLETLGTE